MNIGISIDHNKLHCYVGKTVHKELYRTSGLLPEGYYSQLQAIDNLINTIQRRFGKAKFLGVSVSENCLNYDADDQQLMARWRDDIEQRTRLQCHMVKHSQSAVLAESIRVKPYQKDKVMGVFLDHSCGVEVVDKCRQQDIAQQCVQPWAHSLLPEFDSFTDGLTPVCRCGNEMCIEQFITVEGIERQYHQVVLKDKSLSEIYTEIGQCHSHAVRIYRAFLDQLARSLSMLVDRYRPAHMVLFGSVASYHSLASDLKLALARYCDCSLLPHIALSQLDEFVYAQGASMLKVQKIKQ
ncbi:ROK family protein [Vibrio sp. 99-8-1]|uniref:ROK family protein n=1 Tax=Vibrio sp. 99-8-1 TaxID=2607602 RepID=UPI001493C01D|nr:ROK family protein [Vibrio sp. 99-8-1]NOI64664.1 ROK family protein [Vibrio sp. 99-8-1]